MMLESPQLSNKTLFLTYTHAQHSLHLRHWQEKEKRADHMLTLKAFAPR